MLRHLFAYLLIALFSMPCYSLAEEPARQPNRRQGMSAAFQAVSTMPGSVVLGRPTDEGVTLSMVWHTDQAVQPVWGSSPQQLSSKGSAVRLKAGVPMQVRISGLKSATRYSYALIDPASGRRILPVEQPGSFQTARMAGASFSFAVQADSHLDDAGTPQIYQTTLANIRAARPDFLIDLGDTFMTEKHPSLETARQQYALQHYLLGQVGQSASLFLVLGNHDGESLPRNGRVTADDLSAWSHQIRTRYFANPVPDSFYSGNQQPYPGVGLLQDYYAFTWGDALFVMLDPYWTSLPTKGGREPWNMTIGTAQYRWLEQTLKGSTARFTFVFIHQLTGSYHPAGRGGAEAAAYQEWGGKELGGSDSFAAHRPEWGMPIHQLLVKHGVTAVFHGHDHFYAHQELDGISYQLVPQPGSRSARSNHADEYGYKQGTLLGGAGFVKVEVTPQQATVSYQVTTTKQQFGNTGETYVLKPR